MESSAAERAERRGVNTHERSENRGVEVGSEGGGGGGGGRKEEETPPKALTCQRLKGSREEKKREMSETGAIHQ